MYAGFCEGGDESPDPIKCGAVLEEVRKNDSDLRS